MVDKLDVPILPLATLEDLPTTIQAFHRPPCQPTTTARQWAPSAMQTLLPYCTIQPRLSEHATNVLSDITSDFRDLVDKAATAGGQSLLRNYLGEQEGESVISFWRCEHAAIQ